MRCALLSAVLTGCTLVVGGDPHLDYDAGADASDAAVTTDVGTPPHDAGTDDVAVTPKCDANGCNTTKNACKKTCGNVAKACNEACDESDGKGCHDLCAVQQTSCNIACVMACDQCVMGCAPPCSN